MGFGVEGLVNQENRDHQQIKINIANQQTTSNKVLKILGELEMQAIKLATMEEQEPDHIQKARAKLDVGIQDIT